MLKSAFLLGVSLFLTCVIEAQTIAPQSVNSSGMSTNQTNGSLSYTVGELVILSNTDSNGNYLGSGFTSGATISTATLVEPNPELLRINIFPNPTSDLVTISIQQCTLDYFQLEVTDLAGKLILSEQHKGIVSTIGINASSWESGTYVISIKNSEKTSIGSYKLIKR